MGPWRAAEVTALSPRVPVRPGRLCVAAKRREHRLGVWARLVAREPWPSRDPRPRDRRPGTLTTAYFTLRLVLGDFPNRVLPSSRSRTHRLGRRRRRAADPRGPADVLRSRVHKVLDRGEWWLLRPGCPCHSCQRRAPRSRLGAAARALGGVRSPRSNPGSTTGRRPRVRLQFGRGIDAQWPTGSSRCTSTS